MSTPQRSPRKRLRLSNKLCTPGTEFGYRSYNGEKRYSLNPQRLGFCLTTNFDESDNDGLDDLIGQTWKVYRVSPLSNFSYTVVRLKQYSRRLREGLAVLQRDPMKSAYFDVTFAVQEGLAQTEHDKEAVKIVVNLIPNETNHRNENNPPKQFYFGYLLSRGSVKSMDDASLIHLPVLLCRGSVGSIENTHNLIQKFFDCSISPLTLSQEDLAWICAIIADKSQNIAMQFTFPQVSVRNRLDFKLPEKNISMLWQKIHRSTSEYISDEEIKQFKAALLEQLTKVFQIDICQAQLVQMKTKDLTITRECKFAAKLSETMNQVLKILYEVSTIIDTPVPPLDNLFAQHFGHEMCFICSRHNLKQEKMCSGYLIMIIIIQMIGKQKFYIYLLNFNRKRKRKLLPKNEEISG